MHNFNRIRQVAPMCSHRRTDRRHLANTPVPSVCGGDAVLCHFDHGSRALIFEVEERHPAGPLPGCGNVVKFYNAVQRGPICISCILRGENLQNFIPQFGDNGGIMDSCNLETKQKLNALDYMPFSHHNCQASYKSAL